jgi:farnesyl diphosphate synthase
LTPKPRDLSPALLAFGARAEATLSRVLPAETQAPESLHRAMRYAVLGGGKRLRPLLVYATGVSLGAALERLDAAAAAVEIIHAYSLVHDDLPAMDNDDLRRGRPTCHIAFGEATAILAGDALQALGFEVLANDTAPQNDHLIHVQMLQALAGACGSHGMAGGQAFDLDAVGQRIGIEQLERMHVHKTGALIRACVRLGALATGCRDDSTLAALDRYAHNIGLAFQIRDDILDVEGETSFIGKPQGSDQARDKPTYPALLGLAESRRRLMHLTEAAQDELRTLAIDAALLGELALFVAERQS